MSTNKPRVLIVDDARIARETMAALLDREGYHLSMVPNAEEALEYLKFMVPDVVLLDVMMPGMDGFELCRRIRQNPLTASVPIIMVTAVDGVDNRLQAIEAGADDFINKPYDGVELRARLRAITHLNRQRQQREVELKQERDRTRAILEAVGEAVVVTDRAGNIEYLNPTAVALTGFRKGEMAGEIWSAWQEQTLPPTLYRQMQEVIQAGQNWRGEGVCQRKDGTYYHAAITVTPFFDPNTPGSTAGFVSVYRDVTALKEAQHLKERFISNVSHELRNPLSVITLLSGNLDNLYDRIDDNKRRQLISEIRKEARSLKELINGVLDISRLDSGNVVRKHTPIDLSKILPDEVEKHRPLAQKKKQILQKFGYVRAFINGNETELRQIVRNLLSNAIKYTPEMGCITCQYLILDERHHQQAEWPGNHKLPAGRWIGFSVTDTGLGISIEEQPHIFERFYRAHHESNLPGTGLGLSITRTLVQLHGGHIYLSSMPGVGSIFAVYFPLLEQNRKEPENAF
ncbi:MAG: response regulator [Ardenticatenaceae bacterium]